jgi:hypothetical protein
VGGVRLAHQLFCRTAQVPPPSARDFYNIIISLHRCACVLSCCRVGTPYYVAPEVLRQSYSFPADVWSAGVTAYQLLTGRFPWHADPDWVEEQVRYNAAFVTLYCYMFGCARTHVIRVAAEGVEEHVRGGFAVVTKWKCYIVTFICVLVCEHMCLHVKLAVRIEEQLRCGAAFVQVTLHCCMFCQWHVSTHVWVKLAVKWVEEQVCCAAAVMMSCLLREMAIQSLCAGGCACEQSAAGVCSARILLAALALFCTCLRRLALRTWSSKGLSVVGDCLLISSCEHSSNVLAAPSSPMCPALHSHHCAVPSASPAAPQMSANAAGRRLRSSQVGQSNTSNKALWRAIMYGQLDWQWAWHNISGGGTHVLGLPAALQYIQSLTRAHNIRVSCNFQVGTAAGCCSRACSCTVAIGRLAGRQVADAAPTGTWP